MNPTAPVKSVAERDLQQIHTILDQIFQAGERDPVILDQLHVALIPLLRRMHQRGRAIADWDEKRWGPLG